MKQRQRGMSLVELLVAMTVGLFLIGAVAGLYVATANSARGSLLESQMNEDASLALEILQQQIRLAGYSGFKSEEERNFQGIGIRGCDGGFDDNTTNTDFNDLNTCAKDGTGADALAIRYEATVLNTQPAWNATLNVHQPTNCSFSAITAWPGAGGDLLALADNRYYVAKDASNDNAPTLFCKGKNGSSSDNGFQAATALVPNIEDLQIMYAVTALPEKGKTLPHQITGYVEASDATLENKLVNWSRVAGVHICLLARTSRPVPMGGGSRAELGSYVDCKGERRDGRNDGFLRRAFHTTVQLRNVRPAVPSSYAKEASGTVRDPWAYLTEIE